MNHSCNPNARAAYFDGNVVYLVATRDIEPGDEVTISYGMVSVIKEHIISNVCRTLHIKVTHHFKLQFYKWHQVAERRKQLADYYFFECQCTACTQGTQPVVNAYRCTFAKCRGPVVDQDDQHVCLKCKKVNQLDMAVIEADVDSANRMVGLAMACLDADNAQKLVVGERLLKDGHLKLSTLLYKSHTQLAVAMDILSGIYKRMDRLEEAVSCSNRFLDMTRSDFDEDVHLFNAQIKTVASYRALLEALVSDSSSGDGKRLNKARREATTVVADCETQLKRLTPEYSSEMTYFTGILNIVKRLVDMDG